MMDSVMHYVRAFGAPLVISQLVPAQHHTIYLLPHIPCFFSTASTCGRSDNVIFLFFNNQISVLVFTLPRKPRTFPPSQEPPTPASLFIIANSREWFAGAGQDFNSGTILMLSPFNDHRSAFATAISEDRRLLELVAILRDSQGGSNGSASQHPRTYICGRLGSREFTKYHFASSTCRCVTVTGLLSHICTYFYLCPEVQNSKPTLSI
ncbi:hypothetical protein DFJ58DRAFT_839599 [Suillus subalutaceus]|uniref:uncharacterized protein n=1 Tax=Suillus subalutaceus TaxID=48586 RepID=UPI001B876942|nr:uncharacterized protein DFJ58DRAFT_839599 [Suillus subalutaceus]KAG1861767.1 hypothetical protein DFJ58DRAFT_839599 [Suillus subalutaceus]